MNAPALSQAGFLAGAMCRLALSAILAQSAWHALRDVPAHAAALRGYRLLPESCVPAAAWGLPSFSLLAALLLLAPQSSAIGAGLGAALLVAFAGAIAINLHRGRLHIDCGCGGAQGQHISAGLVVRNAVLLAALAIACAVPAAGRMDFSSLVCMAGGAASLTALYFTANQLLANRAAFRAAGHRA